MCVMSVVHDHYNHEFDRVLPPNWPFPLVPTQPAPQPQIPPQSSDSLSWLLTLLSKPEEMEKLRQLIADFKAAVEMAAKLDVMTKQPDCVDPEKAQLQNRIKLLEQTIARLQSERIPST